MTIARRTLMRGGAAVAFGLLPLPFVFERQSSASTDMLPRDPRGLLDLAPGFRYSILQEQFAPMSDGLRMPAVPDGMGCFKGPGDTLVLMRNHEIGQVRLMGPYAAHQSVAAEAYDRKAYGGVTRLVLDRKSLRVLSSNLVLTGTIRNCSGGVSPWGWLTCEETTEEGHGYTFLCRTDATSVQRPQRITGYGRYNHEAVCIDPTTHIAYLTEDKGDSCLYRFVPHDKARPFEGKLQALRVIGSPRLETTHLKPRQWFDVDWVDVAEPDPKEDTVREQAQERGAALFRRGEGIAYDRDSVYFTCTSGGPADAGQVFRLKLGRGVGHDKLVVAAQSESKRHMDMPDNLTMAPWGDIIVAEDGGSPNKYIRGIRADGRVYDIARNARSGGEFGGVCFSPDGQTLFFNMFREGLTVAVKGPFASFADQANS